MMPQDDIHLTIHANKPLCSSRLDPGHCLLTIEAERCTCQLCLTEAARLLFIALGENSQLHDELQQLQNEYDDATNKLDEYDDSPPNGEAEELRQRIEAFLVNLTEETDIDAVHSALQTILDEVDARDSVAFIEQVEAKRAG